MVNTDVYLILGLGVVTVILGGYTLTLVMRMRSAARQLITIKALSDNED